MSGKVIELNWDQGSSNECLCVLIIPARAVDEPGYIKRAERAAAFVVKQMRDEQGRLLRVWRKGVTSEDAYLDDYAYLLEGLIELHEATDAPKWLTQAKRIADEMIDRFEDEENQCSNT